jgi:prevent-host-death family protein
MTQQIMSYSTHRSYARNEGGSFVKTAAVSQLKASLAGYLASVQAGEEILVTDRGRPIAKLVPIDRGAADVPSRLARLERAGLVRVGSGLAPDFWERPLSDDPEDGLIAALLAERDENR